MRYVIDNLKQEIIKRNKKIKEIKTEIKKLESAIVELERKYKKNIRTKKRSRRKQFVIRGLTAGDKKPLRQSRGRGKRFSKWEDDVMFGMLESGESITAVAKKLGRTYSSVMNRKIWVEKQQRKKELQQRGIPKQVKFVYDDEPEQKKRGRPKGSKNKKRKTRKYRHFTKAEDKMIVGMRNNGYNIYQIAKRLRRHSQSVKQRADVLDKRMGL